MAYGEPITLTTLLIIAAVSAAVGTGGAVTRAELEKSAARKRLESKHVTEAYDIVTARRQQATQAAYQQLALNAQAAQKDAQWRRVVLVGSGLVGLLIATLAWRKAKRRRGR